MSGSWFVPGFPGRRGSTRLFCFPYSGGGTSIYRRWPELLPDHIEIWPIQLPGHGARRHEAPVRELAPLTADLADAIAGVVDPSASFSLFGHSLGAILAFEVARRLRNRRIEPSHLIVSGRRAPRLSPRGRVALDDAGIVQFLRRFHQDASAILEDPGLREHGLRVLSAEMNLAESYVGAPEPPLEAPITAFTGSDDEYAAVSEVDAWRFETRGRFQLNRFAGGHFFIHSAEQSVVSAVAERLRFGVAIGSSRA